MGLPIKIENLTIRYGDITAVKDFSLTIGNETVVLFGPSGCGKTSILRAILGVSAPKMHVSGKVLLQDQQTQDQNGEIGMVFQGPVIPSWIKVGDLCGMGRRISSNDETAKTLKIEDTLVKFQIEHLADRYPHELSGGQKQRVALAVALVNEPKALLLDEPTTFLDGMTRLAIWNFLETQIRPLGIPTVIVSHDPIEALHLGDRIILLAEQGQIRDSIIVPFPHPRTDVIEQSDCYWTIRNRIVSSESHPLKGL